MVWKNFWPACVLGLALVGMALLPAPSNAREEKALADKIAKLVEQLGSDAFAERNAASKALDEIGAPALEALRGAMKSTDAEVRRRSTALVATIEARTQTSRILSPKMVELKYKDTPLGDAVADFSKKSGYPLNLIDPAGKLKSKKITLDTGKVTFWEALEKFKVAAELDEADPMAMMRVPGGPLPPVGPPVIGFGGGAPGFGGVAPMPAPALPPAVLEKLKEAIKRRAKDIEERKKEAEKGGDDSPVSDTVADEKPVEKPAEGGAAPGAVPGAAPGAVGEAESPPVLVDPVPPDGLPGGVPGGGPGGPGWNPAMNLFQHGKINLVAGKPAKAAVDTRSSVRIRAMPAGAAAGMPFPMPAGKKTLTVMLQAAPEPRLKFQQISNVTIEKAIDDNDQKLTQAKPVAPGAAEDGAPGVGAIGGGAAIGGAIIIGGPGGVMMPGFPGGMPMWSNDGLNHNFPVLLTPGAKASKTLKELTGTLTAKFLADAFPAIEVADVMKAKGKTVKGTKGGSITVKDVTKAADGTVTINFEFDQPTDLMPEMGNFAGGIDMPAPGIGIMPVPLPAPAPPPPGAAPGDADAPVEAPPVKVKPAKPAKIEDGEQPVALVDDEKPVEGKPVEVNPGIVIGGGRIVIGGGGAGIVIGGPAIMPFPGPDGGPGVPFTMNGLSLQDDKGKTLPANIQIDWKKAAAGGGFGGVGPGMKAEYIAIYRPIKGAAKEPSKLVFTARPTVEVAVPFTLKDVPVK
jgi:hypothetical protein